MELRAPTTLETPRLRLRGFTPDDIAAHARIVSDPLVTRYLPRGPYPAEQAPKIAQRTVAYFIEHWEKLGFGVWALTDPTTGALIGQCGLNHLAASDEIEVLYLLDRSYWGAGFATEAARAAVETGFDRVGLGRIIGLTAPQNLASQRVLHKVGLRYEEDAVYFGMDVKCFALDRAARAEFGVTEIAGTHAKGSAPETKPGGDG
jgi:[ribosomal protein S5]-alanine N-acetyltransferase